jgi:HEAT repeat protein
VPSGGGAFTRRGDAEPAADWRLWWRWNSEPYLRRESPIAAPTGSTTVDLVQTELLPTLVGLLRDEDASRAASSLLALARVTPKNRVAHVSAFVRQGLRDDDASVRDAALLALGILGDRDALAPLAAVVADRPEGRELTGEDDGVCCNRRQLAALALGLVGGEEAADALLAAVARPICPDLYSTALLAAAHAAPSSRAVATAARAKLADERLDATVRAGAAVALARLDRALGRCALAELLELSAARETPEELRAACVLALGTLSTLDDAPVLDEMRRRANAGGDARARRFAFLALGRILERELPQERDDARRGPWIDLLVESSLHSARSADRPWSLLALGIALRGEIATPRSAAAAAKLRERLRDASQPEIVEATALALGLMRDAGSVPLLAARLDDRPAAETSVALLQALGMTGRPEAAAAVVPVAVDPETLPWLRVEAARALALLGDGRALAPLLAQLDAARGAEQTAALLHAVGALREPAAIAPLSARLVRAELPDAEREVAAAALAELAEPGAASWWRAYSIDQDLQLRAPVLRALLPR